MTAPDLLDTAVDLVTDDTSPASPAGPAGDRARRPLSPIPLDCSVCEYIRVNHWIGNSAAPGRSHCRVCHRTWASLIEAHCVVCHRHFSKYAAADAHVIDDQHVDPATVMRRDGRRRFTHRTTRFGVTWRLAFYGELPDFDDDDDDRDDDTGDDDFDLGEALDEGPTLSS